MVGGVMEGLLYNEFGNFGFKELIEKAREARIILDDEACLIDEVR
jgi:hypothetical protein